VALFQYPDVDRDDGFNVENDIPHRVEPVSAIEDEGAEPLRVDVSLMRPTRSRRSASVVLIASPLAGVEDRVLTPSAAEPLAEFGGERRNKSDHGKDADA